MVYVLGSDAPAELAGLIDEMFQVRRQVFVDGLGWDLAVDTHGREVDGYDTASAVYLIASASNFGGHLASVRLRPTTGAHLTADVFSDLCAGGAPRGEDVWEITRLCVTPGVSRDQALRARREVCAGVIEFGLLHGIERYSCVLDLSWLPTFLNPGWEVTPLGEPRMRNGEMLGAFAIHVSSAFLRRYRAQHHLPAGVLDFARRRAA